MSDTPLMDLIPYWKSRNGEDAPKAQAYRAASEGIIPTIRVGRLLKVPTRLADQKLGIVRAQDHREMEAA
jgi:hypothetical protein